MLPERKRLMDTVRMIAYRAETAMMGLRAGPGLSPSAVRRLLQDLFVAEADILPDTENNPLTVRVYDGSKSAVDRALEKLFKHLNNAEVKYPPGDRHEARVSARGNFNTKHRTRCQLIFLEVRSSEIVKAPWT